MASIFSKIIKGEIPSYKVAEDKDNYAFLDINPLAEGHVLCVPKQEVDYLFDLSPEAYASLTLFAQKVAKGIKAATGCTKVGVAVLGFDVPHAHIHLVPLNSEADMDFRKPKLTLPEDEMRRIADAIAANFE